jgi:hypothetical protein
MANLTGDDLMVMKEKQSSPINRLRNDLLSDLEKGEHGRELSRGTTTSQQANLGELSKKREAVYRLRRDSLSVVEKELSRVLTLDPIMWALRAPPTMNIKRLILKYI